MYRLCKWLKPKVADHNTWMMNGKRSFMCDKVLLSSSFARIKDTAARVAVKRTWNAHQNHSTISINIILIIMLARSNTNITFYSILITAERTISAWKIARTNAISKQIRTTKQNKHHSQKGIEESVRMTYILISLISYALMQHLLDNGDVLTLLVAKYSRNNAVA